MPERMGRRELFRRAAVAAAAVAAPVVAMPVAVSEISQAAEPAPLFNTAHPLAISSAFAEEWRAEIAELLEARLAADPDSRPR